MTLDDSAVLLVAKPVISEILLFGRMRLSTRCGARCSPWWWTLPLRLSLKCAPAHALALRAEFPAVEAGYHLDKRHWITITVDGSLPEPLLLDLIDESYTLVVKKLPKAKQGDLLT